MWLVRKITFKVCILANDVEFYMMKKSKESDFVKSTELKMNSVSVDEVSNFLISCSR